MIENRERVNTFRVSAICECGGQFLMCNVVLMSNPPKYPHKCTKCSKRSVFSEQYPRIEHENET
jgi:hypothetical protein